MFRLPVCPYCKTVYGYNEVKKALRKKEVCCYHCKNKFKKGGIKGLLLFALIFIVLAVILNLVLLGIVGIREVSLVPLFLLDCALAFIAYLLYPFFTEFGKTDNKTKEIPTSKIISENHKEKKSVRIRNRKKDSN